MFKDADKQDKIIDDEEQAFVKAQAKKGFFSRLNPYNKPVINVLVGIIFCCISGALYPIFGVFLSKALFSLMIPDNKAKLASDTDFWVLMIFLNGVVQFLTAIVEKSLFGVIAENITYNVRKKLYDSILNKHLGWFDDPNNSPGVLN